MPAQRPSSSSARPEASGGRPRRSATGQGDWSDLVPSDGARAVIDRPGYFGDRYRAAVEDLDAATGRRARESRRARGEESTPGVLGRAWELATDPGDWERASRGVMGPGDSHQAVSDRARERVRQAVAAAEAEATRRAGPGPIEGGGGGNRKRPSHQGLSPEQAEELRRAERARRGQHEPPAVVTNEDADRRDLGLPIDGEARRPGPRLLSPGYSPNVDELHSGLGKGLGSRIHRDARSAGGPEAANVPDVAWPDPPPPRPRPYPGVSSSGGPPSASGPAIAEGQGGGPGGSRGGGGRPEGSRDLERLAAVLERLAGNLERSPAPLTVPPPVRGSGVRM